MINLITDVLRINKKLDMNKIHILLIIILMNLGMANAQNNPLLGDFNTPHKAAPFDKIENEHFLPAFNKSIEVGEAEIKAIIDCKKKPTFENTIVALENTGRL